MRFFTLIPRTRFPIDVFSCELLQVEPHHHILDLLPTQNFSTKTVRLRLCILFTDMDSNVFYKNFQTTGTSILVLILTDID